MKFRALFDFRTYLRFVKERVQHSWPNLRGALLYPPGHYYSPLLDFANLGPDAAGLPFDGIEWWDHVDLQREKIALYYADLLDNFPPVPFPSQKTEGYRYYTDNVWFIQSDAFVLSAIIQKEKPRRIVEIGSGFSSAVILDTLERTNATAELTCIEPHPERLFSLLFQMDRAKVEVVPQQVQEVSLSIFDRLEAQDLVLIDSSHVAKIGSDVAFLLLRVLPRLKRGVLVHIHDVLYPMSYPIDWIRDGIAWNESLFLRAFLIGNSQFEITAFNSYAGYSFPDVFQSRFPGFLQNTGGSIWLRKVR